MEFYFNAECGMHNGLRDTGRGRRWRLRPPHIHDWLELRIWGIKRGLEGERINVR